MLLESDPPTTSTLPEGSSVAVCPWRATDMDAVAENAPKPLLADGSNNSAVEKLVERVVPPATSTSPVSRGEAAWPARAIVIDPVTTNAPTPPLALGSNSSALD